ncbi:MAG: hypothetical protein G01um101433_271 [Parcubacteria group bacterium Gr01-1014_33]|nr:MAG: hypothetical protein G01um101433_271 [Parcubacteria group bacterium Gr01-1014_33]
MTTRNFIAGLATASVIAGGCASFIAFAQTPPPATPSDDAYNPPRQYVEIRDTGKVIARGAKVTSVASTTNSFMVATSWGGYAITWVINIDDETEFMRRSGGRAQFSEIITGHIVSFEGDIATTTASQPVVKARKITNWSLQNRQINQFGTVTSIDAGMKGFMFKTDHKRRGTLSVWTTDATQITKQQATTTFSTIKTGDLLTVNGMWDMITNTVIADRIKIHVQDRRVFQNGKLKSITASTTPTSFIVTFGSFDYTVNVGVDTAILNQQWAPASLQNFRLGDHIRVYGVSDGTTIEATVVRDVSLK